MPTKVDTETAWITKPSSIRCFDDWFRREDFGDRDQLERCWANAQNVAARDRKDAPPSDFEQLIQLRKAAEAALLHLQGCGYKTNQQVQEQLSAALSEALATTGEK